MIAMAFPPMRGSAAEETKIHRLEESFSQCSLSKEQPMKTTTIDPSSLASYQRHMETLEEDLAKLTMTEPRSRPPHPVQQQRSQFKRLKLSPKAKCLETFENASMSKERICEPRVLATKALEYSPACLQKRIIVNAPLPPPKSLRHDQSPLQYKKQFFFDNGEKLQYGRKEQLDSCSGHSDYQKKFSIQRKTIKKSKLWAAVERGDEVTVRHLLKENEDIEEKFKNWSPLMKAAEEGHVKIIKLLLEKNANLEVTNLKGRTALSFAAAPSMGRDTSVEALRMLLKAGADAKKADRNGNTPKDHAKHEKREDAVAILEEFEKTNSQNVATARSS